jgi:4-carboxymuconolactone decarboxylase
VPQDKQHIFDSIAESRGRVGGPFAVLLNSPEVAGRAAHLGSYLRFETALNPRQRELAIITAAREWNCALEWGGHVQLARQEGVREEAIDVVGRKAPADGLTDDERMIVRYARELLHNGRVSNETFAAAYGALGDRGVTDLTATIGYYSMLACALNAFEVEPAPGAPPLPEA